MNDKKPKKPKKYDLEERLIRFAVAILELVDMLPNSRAGNRIANQIVNPEPLQLRTMVKRRVQNLVKILFTKLILA